MFKLKVVVLTSVLVSAGAAYAQDGGSPMGGTLRSGGPAAGEMSAANRLAADLQARAKATVEAMDTNKDGTVSPEEYRTAELANFAKLDANGDGKFTADELSAGRGGGRGAPQATAAQLVGDTNKDGAVSQAEFITTIDKEYKTIDKDWNNKITQIEMLAKVRNQTPAAPMPMGSGGAGGAGGRGGR